MFYTETNILLTAAVLPGLLLAFYIYRQDKIEHEPAGLLAKLFFAGVLSTIPAAIAEGILIPVANSIFGSGYLFLFVETFLIVAVAEEFFKYRMLNRVAWNNHNFNFRFDAIVYAAFVGIGFAVFENIQYVFSYGFATAVLRAVTAVPAHTIFAIFMGHYYGNAKLAYDLGYDEASAALRKKAILVPVLLHGFYDFVASLRSGIATLVFWVFLIIIEITAFRRLRRDSREDTPV